MNNVKLCIGTLEAEILQILGSGEYPLRLLAVEICGDSRKCYEKVWKSVRSLERKGLVSTRRDKNRIIVSSNSLSKVIVSHKTNLH